MDKPYYAMTALFPPTVIDMPHSGKRYAMSGSIWIEVTPDVTQKMVQDAWTKLHVGPPLPVEEVVLEDKSYATKSDKTGETYRVSRQKGVWSCTCPGFEFRKKCKHVDQQKANNE